MFNFFKKKEKAKDLEKNAFLNDFTEEQKAAMVYSLMLMTGANGSYDEKKLNYTMQQAKLLNLNLEGKAMAIYQEKNADYAYSIIKRIPEEKKGWYSVLLGSILGIGGKPTEKELTLIARIVEQCGISEKDFHDVNTKTQALMKNIK